MRDAITISNAAAAAAFASPIQSRIVQTLIGAEMTLAGLARALETPMSLAHYHVARCVELGLIAVVRVQPRAGRAVKHYRATAKSFFVPSELLGDLPGTDMTRQLRAALDRGAAKSVLGVRYDHDGRDLRVRLVRDPEMRPSAAEFWLQIGLSAADAAALVGDLEAVIERYKAKAKDTEAKHLVHLALAKL